MATKQKSRSTRSRSKSAAKSRAKSTASKRRAAVEPGGFRRAAGLVLDGHGHDLAGVILIALGLVSAIGVYGKVSSWVPHSVAVGLAWVFGGLRYFAPLVLMGIGGLLIRGPAELDDENDEEEADMARHTRIRVWLGGALMLLSTTALVHVLSAPKRPADWKHAGGLIGGIVGAPLGGAIGKAGAAAILVLLAVLSLSLLTGRSIVTLGRSAAEGMAPARSAAWTWISGLFRVGDELDDDEEEEDDEATAVLYDHEADADNPLARKQRAPRKKKPSEPTIILPDVAPANSAEQLHIDLGPVRDGSPWTLPPLTLLSRSRAQQIDTPAITARGRELEAALAEHGVTTRLVGMVVGPTVTRYELELGVGIKVNQVINLSKDIAYAMATPDVRIIAPIPGKQAIGVEVPNKNRQVIALGDILASPEAAKASSPLSVAVGRDIEGKSVMIDLASMPHILIAGQTGAGKSSCINSIMTSILMRATPDDVRLILIDPKRVELTQYNRVPHLLTQVVTNPKKAANALAWAVAEVERRYELLEDVGVRDIGGYNSAFDRGSLKAQLGEDREFTRLPLILIVVDELADLMMVAARDVEESINRIAAKARAVGVHLVIATQRPSVNVITGVIKANIPARFAFAVASQIDSKVIMNQVGAERLVGKGDMLLLGPTSSAPDRIQGCWVEEKEVSAIVATWRKQAPEVTYVEEVQRDANLSAVSQQGSGAGGGDDDDELLWQAMELVVRSQLGSTSMLQRKLKVGFSRAGRLMDLLEERGVVGQSEGSKARTVQMTVDELDELLAQR